MSKTFRPWNVEQKLLLPPCVLDFVPADHLVHFVRDTVREDLDLSGVLDQYTEEKGYPPYDPVMMTGLLLYGYCQGIYSSRRLARACAERMDFMALTAMQTPDFRTISLFRKRHLKALGGLFVQVLRLCRRAGLVKLGHVALDGTKIRANASKHKAMSYGRMRKAEEELAAEVQSWFDQAEAIDTREDAEYGADKRGDELPEWVADRQKRLEKIRQAKAALEAEAKAEVKETEHDKNKPKRGPKFKHPPGVPRDTAQRNFTDPESRIMKNQDGFIQAYNAQAAVDAQSQVIVAETLTHNASDNDQFNPLIEQIKTNLGRQAREVSADAGYCSEENLRELNRRHIRGYVATGRQRQGDDCATGNRKIKPGTQVEAMARRLRQGGRHSRYRLRKQTTEPVFGQIKAARGFRQFLMRGLDKVAGEWTLLCTAHNLLKLANSYR